MKTDFLAHPSASRGNFRLPVLPVVSASTWPLLRRSLAATLCLLLALLAWDASGLDLAMAQWSGTSQGFALQHNHWIILLLHEVPRALSMVGVAALLLGMVWPWGFLKRLTTPDRVQLALSVLGAIALTTLVKRTSATSCPWDLLQFGGAVPYVSHWAWGLTDGGSGHCFPAGHASAAFGFVAAWWVLGRCVPNLAKPWLMAALGLGLLLGVAQQMRGAHFMSHTLWTAWICWSFGLAWECVRTLVYTRREARLANLNQL